MAGITGIAGGMYQDWAQLCQEYALTGLGEIIYPSLTHPGLSGPELVTQVISIYNSTTSEILASMPINIGHPPTHTTT